jgi:hypothetical protein
MPIEIKNRYTGAVIFSHTQENNSIKSTVEMAVDLGASLNRTDLGASLNGADLTSADLTGASLNGARLDCVGNMREIFTLQLDTWRIGFTKTTLQIGCQRHSIDEWRSFTDIEIAAMSLGALKWWKRWRGPLFAIIDERLRDVL